MLRPGDIVDDRFTVEELAEAGGMGAVYRATDRATGQAVALKVLLHGGEDPRFSHEARVLAQITSSSIVRYVAHGQTLDGLQYLAMEWLAGEDLATRVFRGPLAPAEAVELARRVAEALAILHARGIVHRDLKPANVFLVSGRVDALKLLDLGLARHMEGTRAITRTGSALGTPGYMSPEQARGERDVDGRADLFSLGCVLFECVTGRPAFFADHPLGILAKILFEDAPRARSRRADVPEALDALIARLLCKDRDGRPATALELLAELDALSRDGDLSTVTPDATRAAARPEVLTLHELRLVALVLAGQVVQATTIASSGSIDSAAPTLSIDVDVPSLGALRDALTPFGARLELLADGTAAALLSGSGAATDLAGRAARAALSLRGLLGDVPVAMTVGRAEVSGRVPLGEAIDRAVKLLRFEVVGDGMGLGLLAERERVTTP